MNTPQADKHALATEGLSVRYEGVPALEAVSICIPCGVRCGVFGPNGAGKSTWMKAALGLIPASGDSRFFGLPFAAARTRVAYVPQRAEVDWDFPITVRELAAQGRLVHRGLFGRFGSEDRRAVSEALEQMSLSELAERPIRALSGGQQQRAFIARALAQQADLYLLDEPFAAVDAATEQVLADWFVRVGRSGGTIVCIHHDLGRARSYFDHAVLLNRRLVAAGPIDSTLAPQPLAEAYGLPLLASGTRS